MVSDFSSSKKECRKQHRGIIESAGRIKKKKSSIESLYLVKIAFKSESKIKTFSEH